MVSNKEYVQDFERLVALGQYYSSARPVFVDPAVILEDILSKISLTKEAVVLDAGCGMGVLTFPMAKYCARIYGVDAGEKIIEAANKKCRDENISNVEFQTGNVLQLPFNDGAVDLVFMYSVLQYVQQQAQECVKELVRVCKPGGYIMIGDVPDRKLREEFDKREKTSQELQMIAEYESGKRQYNDLMKKYLGATASSGGAIITFDIELIKEWGRELGCEASSYRQQMKLPMSLTRSDVVLRKRL